MTQEQLRQKLTDIELPRPGISKDAPRPAGNYVPVKLHAGMAFISGQMPVMADGTLFPQSYQEQYDTSEALGYQAARLAMANVFLQLASCSSIQSLENIIRIDGFFSHVNGKDLPQMLNGASDLVSEVLGSENAAHVRTVFGVDVLPYQATVELAVVAAAS